MIMSFALDGKLNLGKILIFISALLGIKFFISERKHAIRKIREWKTKASICPTCDYEWSHVDTPACPECGEPKPTPDSKE